MAGRISMGARREVVSAVAERYGSAKRAEKGAHPRGAVRDDGVASQACGARTSATQDGRGRNTARAAAQIRRDDQGCFDSVVGGVGSGVRQAAQGYDPHLAAGASATRAIEA